MNDEVIAEFRERGGNVGGAFGNVALLLLHHIGAKSGRERVTPLAYWPITEGQVAVLASNFGAPVHPAWYLNLLAHPDVTVEIGRANLRAHARIPADREG